jgi:hypothetical protein
VSALRRVPRTAWISWVLGDVALVAAGAMWFVPWNAFDSRCSLATRNDPNVRGACADDVAALMPWFVAAVATGVVLLVAGAVVVLRARNEQPTVR